MTDPVPVMIDRVPPDGETEAELMVVHVDPDGSVSLLLDDGEMLLLDPDAACALAIAILSPQALRKAA